MDDRKKNKLLNILLAAAVAVIALCALMAVGSARGWFKGAPKVDVTQAGPGTKPVRTRNLTPPIRRDSLR